MPYSADFMYQIVNDVSAYPEFLPWCGGTVIHQQTEDSMEASIQIVKSGLDLCFRTRNRMQSGESIQMELVEGPFSELHGLWQFIPLDDDGSKIQLELKFALKPGLASAIIGPAFHHIANTMVDSFCARARDIHEC